MFNQSLQKTTDEKKLLSRQFKEEFLTSFEPFLRMKTDEFVVQIKDLSNQLDIKNRELIQMSERLRSREVDTNSEDNDKKMFDALEQLEQEYVTNLVQRLEKSYKTDQAIRNEELHQKLDQRDLKISQLTSENESLKLERDLLEKNLTEIKELASAREMNYITELQSLKLNNEQLVEISERREKIVQEEIEAHKNEVSPSF